jgi:hypothetical protein
MTDLEVMFVLFHKEEMIKLGIIPENVKWDSLTKKERQNVKKFLKNKIEKQKRRINNVERNND